MIKYATQSPSEVAWGVAASPVGKLVVGVTGTGEVCRIAFMHKQTSADIVAAWRQEWPHTTFKRGADVADFLRMPVILTGTYFQYQVWNEMAKIPAGRTASYGNIARRIGKPKAVRAVGSACGANPVPYRIPCHRIVSANGIGGFSSGLDIKKKLLRLEGVSF